ncbi:hypothetical protein K438DRAFT_1978732 [Mycena galopus ATCC 62051]|nr:hypothetical protein K438DRAFT_1978732 [Mycena galopus ATCC 62051]
MYRPDSGISFPAPPIINYIYGLDNDAQLQASAVIAQHGLAADSQEDLGNCWSHQWSHHSEKAKVDTQRILYLCACSYDHCQCDTKYDRSEYETPGTQEHQTAAPFTGCLTRAELTVRRHKILRICSHFEHNPECKTTNFSHTPPIPVHPSVYVAALAQLHDGATFSDICQKNRDLFEAKVYTDFPADITLSLYCWLLTHNNSLSLYRQYNPMKAIFHYSACSNKGERFEVAITNDDMNRAAWKYGHESQVILNGTFGVCDSRLLLFIVMTVDENQKGVPVTFLLFSAPTGNRQSSSAYDTAILTKLLKKWSGSLNKCAHSYGHSVTSFKPLSAITDTDLKERRALITVLRDIWLLICRVHLRQLWRNHWSKMLKGKKPVHADLKQRMARLEVALTATQTITDTCALLKAEHQVMIRLSAEHPKAAKKAIMHINYLNNYWTTENLWPSWSDYGWTVLASMLGTAVDGVIPTTNHLKSFNGVLKRIHLQHWQKGGHRLRVDVLIHALVIYVLPSIFKECRLIIEQANQITALVRLLLGSAALLDNKKG